MSHLFVDVLSQYVTLYILFDMYFALVALACCAISVLGSQRCSYGVCHLQHSHHSGVVTVS